MFLSRSVLNLLFFFFFFNDTATTEIYTLSLHDALPICASTPPCGTRSLVHKRTPPLKAGPASFKRLLGCRRYDLASRPQDKDSGCEYEQANQRPHDLTCSGKLEATRRRRKRIS